MNYMGFSEPKIEDEGAFEAADAFDVGEDFDVSSDITPFPKPQVVSSATGQTRRIVTMRPQSYEDAPKIGDTFREGTPVILDLSRMKEPLARQMIDFCSGLVYGLEGSLERITSRVFLLSPASVNVTEVEDKPSTSFFG